MNFYKKLFCLCVPLSVVSASWAQEKHSGSRLSEAIVVSDSFGTAYDIRLGVRAALQVLGRERDDLDGFNLEVKAAFLGPDKMNAESAQSPEPTTLFANEKWFRRHPEDRLQFLKYKETPDKYDTLRDGDWLQKVYIDGRPLHKLGANDSIGNFVIRSRQAMQRYDIIRLGKFSFQPSHPGQYRIDLKLFRGGFDIKVGKPRWYRIDLALVHAVRKLIGKKKVEEAPIETQRLYVYFECPNYRPILRLAGPDTIQLRDIGYQYIHTPIVNTVFFEEAEQPTFNENPTDRIFRTLLLGRAVVGLSCPASEIELYAFPDPLYVKDHPHTTLDFTLERSAQRAKYLEQELRRLSADFIAGIRCGARVASNTLVGNGTPIDPSRCGLSFKIFKKGMDDPLTRALIKREDSIDEGAKYRQENRVVALTVDSTIQKRLFAPLAIKQREVPDYVQFRLRVEKTDGLMPQCLDAGWIVVRRLAGGNSAIQVLSNDEQEALRAGEITVFLDSEVMKAFTEIPGEYEARAVLRSLCDSTSLYSERVSFHAKPKSVRLDEIFALAPFDSAAFSYKYDEERIPTLTDSLFQQIETRMNEAGKSTHVKAALLISGHTDVLGENRGPFYNLGLSFERAYFAEQKLLNEIVRTAKRKGLTLTRSRSGFPDTATCYYISNPMRNKIKSTGYFKPSTQVLLMKVSKKSQRTKAEHDYYEILKTEKLRHFTTEPRRPFDPRLPYSVGAILAQLRKINDDVACGLTTVALRRGEQEVEIDIFTAGFGAAIPFYRKFTLTEELKTIFCTGGLAPNEIPDEIFADDDYPAGRVMNRRIEVSFIVDKPSPETKVISKK